MELHELEDKVVDEESFIEFVKALAKDLDDENEKEAVNPSSPYGSGVNGWENKDLSNFLWTMSHWADTSKNNLPYYKKPENPWQRMANILSAAKIYE